MRKIMLLALVAMLVLGGAGLVATIGPQDSPVVAAKDNGNGNAKGHVKPKDKGKGKSKDKDKGNKGNNGNNGNGNGNGNRGNGAPPVAVNTDPPVQPAQPTPGAGLDTSLPPLVNPDVANAAGNRVVVAWLTAAGIIPADLTVQGDDFVVFTNVDARPHTLSGDLPDIDPLAPGQSAVATWASPGTHEITDAPTGTSLIVTVGPAPGHDHGAGPAATPTDFEFASSPDASAAAGNVFTVEIDNVAYQPASITVTAGTTVRWLNDDGLPHTVTGTWGDSGNIAPGQSFEWTFDQPGTYTYTCAYYPNMTGQVIVTNP